MISVIAHFYNEEKILPYWLEHHSKIFSTGILIDHHSTDASVEICRKIVPHWKIVTSNLSEFDAIDNDFEVMSYEAQIKGWKICLNVSEFLYSPHLERTLIDAEERGYMALRTRGVVMVDVTPDMPLVPDKSLLEQKHHGFIEQSKSLLGVRYHSFVNQVQLGLKTRERILHRYPTGAYHPGRHKSFRKVDSQLEDSFILWFGYAPWCEWNIQRKSSFAKKIPARDIKQGMGIQHLRNVQALQADYELHKILSYDLDAYLNGQKKPALTLKDALCVKWAQFKVKNFS